MDEKTETAASPQSHATDNEARRRFIKSSGGMALAAPAVVLLLSAHSKPAAAVGHYSNTPKGNGQSNQQPGSTSPWNPPPKTLLDP